MLYKVLEMPLPIRLPMPISLVFAYPALDFNYGSWMSPNHLKVLRQESMANFKGISQQKDHFSHASPLSVVDDRPPRRRKSWTRSFSKLPFVGSSSRSEGSKTPKLPKTPGWAKDIPRMTTDTPEAIDSDADSDDEGDGPLPPGQRSISERVQYWAEEDEDMSGGSGAVTPAEERSPMPVMGTRLTVSCSCRLTPISRQLQMTSRSACFGDRILSAPMMRSMALCCRFLVVARSRMTPPNRYWTPKLP
jgi:hypothetical protein